MWIASTLFEHPHCERTEASLHIGSPFLVDSLSHRSREFLMLIFTLRSGAALASAVLQYVQQLTTNVNVEVHLDSCSVHHLHQDIVIAMMFLNEYSCADCWTSGIVSEFCFPICPTVYNRSKMRYLQL